MHSRERALTPAELRAKRSALGLTQERLAEALGVTATTVARWERGERRIGNAALVERALAQLAVAVTSRAHELPVPPRRHNIPAHLSELIGRDQDVVALQDCLLQPESALLTLTGAGGCGKTRLALQVAFELVETFADGVWLVDLAPLGDPSLVVEAAAAVLGVRERSGEPILDSLITRLEPRHLLLVLDNCEHLIDASASLVAALLTACPMVRVLATSREPLRVQGEITWRVASLAFPDPRRRPALDEVVPSPAAQLFTARAHAVQRAFELTAENAQVVAEVCARLDGLPLAIELAAAQMRVLGVEQLRDRLDDRFRLLVGGSRTAPSRQRTLRATLDWSYQLLTLTEQVVLRRLAVFAGGFSLEAAEAVGSGEPIECGDVLEALTGLVDKSLVLTRASNGAARHGLLETLRQYAQDKLREAGEEAALQLRHAEWCLTLVEAVAPHVWAPQEASWLARLELEHDNLRSALAWCEREGGTTGSMIGLRLVDVLHELWFTRGQLTEGRRWLERVLGIAGGSPSPLRVRVLNCVAQFAWHQSDGQYSDERAGQALRLSRDLGYKPGEVVALIYLGSNADAQGEYEQAVVLLEEALRLCSEDADTSGAWLARNNLAETLRHYGEADRTARLVEENLALATQRGDAGGIAQAVRQFGLLAEAQGDYTRAAQQLEESLALFEATGAERGRHWVLLELGRVVHARGDPERARALMGESLRLCREAWDRRGIARCLEGLASLAATTGQPTRAVSLFGAASSLREVSATPALPSDRRVYAPGLAAARDLLDDEDFAHAWDEGKTMPLERAIADAGEFAGPPLPQNRNDTLGAPASATDPGLPPGQNRRTGRLTARQAEVLRLVAQGKTDRQIAAELVLSEKTVGRHLESIFARLGVTSRAAATLVATREGLA